MSMGVYIKGMKMPETCDECPCHHYHSAGKYVCEATPMFYPWNLANTKGIRKEWCPLVELPPHGRMIDADVLTERLVQGLNNSLGQAHAYYKFAKACVKEAPTIIEAEEVSEG